MGMISEMEINDFDGITKLTEFLEMFYFWVAPTIFAGIIVFFFKKSASPFR
jgi:hypothetical protein